MRQVWVGILVGGILFGMAACRFTGGGSEQEATVSPPEDTPAEPVANNQLCFACHGNFTTEWLSVTHANGNVGCVDCHGTSDEHCDDEDNVTPPHKMYAKDQINSLCLGCHDPQKLSVHRRVTVKDKAEFQLLPGYYCTECHGKHRMNLRTKFWDKKTGELLGGPPPSSDDQPVTNELPLLLDDEPLLLLDDPPAETTGPMADNSRCFVCHMNYEIEEFAVTHARADIGCEQCHGPSDAHCNDEDNITPPDIMYPRQKINPFCIECHDKEGLDKEAHEAVLAGTADKDKEICTQCHGEHVLGYRTRRWDKVTRKLIQDDNVRMME